MEKKNWKKWIGWFIFVVAIIFVYRTIEDFQNILVSISKIISILMPFIAAVLLAYLFYLPCRAIERLYKRVKILKKISRGLSVFTVYIIAILLLMLIIKIVYPTVSQSIVDLANNLPSYYNDITSYVSGLPEESLVKKLHVEEAINNLQKINIVQIFSMDNLGLYLTRAIGMAKAIFAIFVTIAVSIYILLERKSILEFSHKLTRALFKEKTSNVISKYFHQGSEIFLKFITSQLLDAIIIGTIMSIALSIMGVKYAILLGVMIGLFNLIPYFGAITATAITAIITIFTGSLSQAVWTLLVMIILQQIDANVINPRLIKNALKLSPILVIFSITLFGAYFGILRNVFSSSYNGSNKDCNR